MAVVERSSRGRGRRSARHVAVLVLLLPALGCTTSKIGADADVRLTGTVLTSAGTPAAAAKVGLVKDLDAAELLVGGTIAVGTLGAVCLVDEPPAICKGAKKTNTADDGTWDLSLQGRDTQGSAGQASDLNLTAVVDGAGGPLLASVRFKVQHTELEVPPLRVWDQALSAPASGGALQPSWAPLPGDYGPDPSYSLRFVDRDGAAVWNVADTAPGQPVDLRLLEDRSGTIELAAHTKRSGPDTTFRFSYFAHSAPFTGAGPPPSRGLGCSAVTTDGQVKALDPCPLTDGDFSKTSGFSADGTVRSGALVDLGGTRTVSLVVARGAIGPIIVETSQDAVSWSIAGTSSGSLVAVTPPGSVPARYVRIRTTGGTDLSSLTELTVWSG